ncbi:hypothetical protein G6F68_020366 [Rhizopus microsporus]|nr:hypothetical protein G6F68_020366 [Rhizopus microsporus]
MRNDGSSKAAGSSARRSRRAAAAPSLLATLVPATPASARWSARSARATGPRCIAWAIRLAAARRPV